MEAFKGRTLLQQTRLLIRHQAEREKLRGESFNIFSVLGVERRENKTHSAFLAELLNPEGSHLQRDLFLRLFLDIIEYPAFDSPTAKVTVEHHIGRRDNEGLTGGRIDIFLEDGFGNCLSIENKIYAGDQFAQVQRYFNYRSDRNLVCYLTLWGNEPSDDSKGMLKSEEHYRNISYKKHIILWLEKCIKESAEIPILRESIKQYLILIKKLTYTMDNSQTEELFNLIIENYEEAQFLASNFIKAIAAHNETFRREVARALKKSLSDDYEIAFGGPTDSAYSQVWIRLKGKEENKIFFGIQSFAAGSSENYPLFIGIFVFKGEYRDEYKVLGKKRNNWWSGIKEFSKVDGTVIDLNKAQFLKRLQFDTNFREAVISMITSETIDYLEANKNIVAQFLADRPVCNISANQA